MKTIDGKDVRTKKWATVLDVIAKLQEFPLDMPVMLSDYGCATGDAETALWTELADDGKYYDFRVVVLLGNDT